MSEKNMPNLDDLKDTAKVISGPDAEEEKANASVAPENTDDDDEAVIVDENAASRGDGAPDQTYKDRSGVSDQMDDAVKERLADMDRQIEQIEEAKKKFYQQPKADADVDPDAIADPNEVTVLIDKTGMGSVTFTEDEKKRLEVAKKIKIVEVQNKKLETVKIKTKKINDVNRSKYIKKTFNRALSPVIALASGYTAKMRNVSSVESLEIMQRPERDSSKAMLEKWSVLYSKLIDPSCGDFADFDDFISKTAYLDYNNFIYSILCNSYPEKDSVSFTCNQQGCGKEFSIDFENRDLIRYGEVTEAQKKVLEELNQVSSFGNPDDAKKYMEEHTLIGQIKRFMLTDNSAIIVDIYVPSVKEQCENILPRVTADMAKRSMQRVTMIAHNVRSILIPDSDISSVGSFDDIEYAEADTFEDIVYLLSEFNEDQLDTIGNQIDKMLSPYMIRYGLNKVVCPFCKHDYGEYAMNLDRLLFQRVQRRMTTEIE